MAYVYVPESQPDSQPSASQRNGEYIFEATQVSQPRFSQTQNTQNTTWEGSQVEPRRKYWATFIPTNSQHSIIKLPWTKTSLQLGRGASQIGNDVVLNEKRVSNKHCKITLGLQNSEGTENGNGAGSSAMAVLAARDSDNEPDVWIEDLKSSNGTFVNGQRISPRRLLQHGDEISLGHMGTLENHDVRYIFRSVGAKGAKFGHTVSRGDMGLVGEVYERYQILEKLGKGTFAEVMRAVDVETGDLRAIKQIIKHRFAGNAKTLALFQREIEISSSLHHENICRLIEHYEDPQHICLVLEYIDGGDLLDHITGWPSENGGGLPEDYAAELTLQICRAMAYTHAMNVTHRDLKPENILLTKGTPDIPATIKIADFGLAKLVDAGTMLKSMVGTPQYLAPEVVMQTKDNVGYENTVDSWSVGIIVYSMLTKALPFDEDPELPIEKRIRNRFTQQFDTGTLESLGISATAIDFINRLLAKRPSERMTLTEALDHEWLAGPSSQKSDSQIQQALGGDSMWSIESFDDYDNDRQTEAESNPDATEDIDGNQAWTRPVTVSATNNGQSYQSSVQGKSGSRLLDRHDSSGDSFSQPMGNLRLNTPATKNGDRAMSVIFDDSPRGNGVKQPKREESIPEYLPDSLPMDVEEASPPSPPLTDIPAPCEITVATPLPIPPLNMNLDTSNPHPSPLPTPTPGTSSIPSSMTNKRKTRGNQTSPPETHNDPPNPLDKKPNDAFFSSGSLSPPPDLEPVILVTTPKKIPASKSPRKPRSGSTVKTPETIEREQVGRSTRQSSRSAKKVVVEMDAEIPSSKGLVTRQSPGSSRTRKSMRLS